MKSNLSKFAAEQLSSDLVIRGPGGGGGGGAHDVDGVVVAAAPRPAPQPRPRVHVNDVVRVGDPETGNRSL